jgi:hypothetical protein
MKYLLLFIFMSAGLQLNAQKVRFMDTANRWTLEHVCGQIGESTQQIYTYKIGKDSLVFGQIYKHIEIVSLENHREGLGGGNCGDKYIGAFFREDTTVKRIFCLLKGDSTEYLVYDENWQVGDTFSCCHGSTQHWRSTVEKRDSTFFNNSWHNVFKISIKIPTYTGFYYIIEGIGSTNGTAYPAWPITFENSVRLRCFSNGGIYPAINPRIGAFDNATSCEIVRLDVSKYVNGSAEIKITPNPGSETMGMEISPVLRKGHLWVVDVLGKVVFSVSIDGQGKIPIGQHLSVPGIYCYILQDDDDRYRYRGRFIFE